MTVSLAAAGGSTYWYLTRSTGAVALLLLTFAIALGVVDVRRWSTPRWPRFVVDSLHRNVSLLAMVFLVLHILTSVLDSFAPISLLDAFIPFAGSYRPFWLGLGAISFDLLLAVTITSLLRQRMGYASWRAIHWLTYASWPIALLHGFGTGSDVKDTWLLALSIGCLAVVLAAVLARVLAGWRENVGPRSVALGGAGVFSLFLLLWLPGGPLGSDWARRSGTPALAAPPTPTTRRHRKGGRVMSGSPLLTGESSARPQPPSAPALPRLLAGIPAHGAMDLDAHLALHGALPQIRDRPTRARGRRDESPLIGRIERAGLRGRGGASFPTATKLRAVASARRRAIVVINAAEGEPASLKDRTLAQMLPHLMLDGGQLAAQALGADELIVCVCESASASIESVAVAIEERNRLPGASARTQLSIVPSHYVAGQESALVNHLNGGPAAPTFTPPMPFEQGVRRRPTLISNAETLAHIALIARHGSQWFRQLGTPSQPGSALVTLSGRSPTPGCMRSSTARRCRR